MYSFLITVILFLCSGLSAQAVIYGTDDRKDVVALDRAQKLSLSTATMVADAYVLPQTSKNTFDLDFYLASSQYSLALCSEEKFANQPSGWLNCTGFLVAEDILVTAGHCMLFSHGGVQGIIQDNVPASSMCSSFKWVFDFAEPAVGVPAVLNGISNDKIYSCEKVIYAESLGVNQDPITGQFSTPLGGQHGTDFAIIKLDRKVVGREPLTLTSTLPAVSEDVMVLGYPSALPAKYAPGSVLPGDFINYFLSDLDILGGNSGSPVFNNQNQVAGIVVRGFPYEDYIYVPERDCYKAIVCEKMGEGDCLPSQQNEIIGTHVQKSVSIIDRLKLLGIIK